MAEQKVPPDQQQKQHQERRSNGGQGSKSEQRPAPVAEHRAEHQHVHPPAHRPEQQLHRPEQQNRRPEQQFHPPVQNQLHQPPDARGNRYVQPVERPRTTTENPVHHRPHSRQDGGSFRTPNPNYTQNNSPEFNNYNSFNNYNDYRIPSNQGYAKPWQNQYQNFRYPYNGGNNFYSNSIDENYYYDGYRDRDRGRDNGLPRFLEGLLGGVIGGALMKEFGPDRDDGDEPYDDESVDDSTKIDGSTKLDPSLLLDDPNAIDASPDNSRLSRRLDSIQGDDVTPNKLITDSLTNNVYNSNKPTELSFLDKSSDLFERASAIDMSPDKQLSLNLDFSPTAEKARGVEDRFNRTG